MTQNTANVVSFPAQEAAESQRSFAARWKHEELFGRGYVPLPTLFLHHYANLKPYPLSAGEAMFVLHLMEFKWDSRSPYPSYRMLARRMNVSDKAVRRHAQNLETKKLLKRGQRIGGTNRFDLTPLFDALKKAVEQDRRAAETDDE